LAVGNLIIDGRDASDFAITAPPAASVAAGASTTFTITFTGGAGMDREATVHLPSNDLYVGLFHLPLSATVAGGLMADFTSSTTVPLHARGLTATGSQVTLALHHVPRTGYNRHHYRGYRRQGLLDGRIPAIRQDFLSRGTPFPVIAGIGRPTFL